MVECRHLITGKSTNTLENSNKSIMVCKISKWCEYKTKWVLKHLRIGKLIVVLIGKYRSSSDKILKGTSGRITRIRSDENTDRRREAWLSSTFSYHLLCFGLSLIEYLIGISCRCTRSIRSWSFFILYESIEKP